MSVYFSVLFGFLQFRVISAIRLTYRSIDWLFSRLIISTDESINVSLLKAFARALYRRSRPLLGNCGLSLQFGVDSCFQQRRSSARSDIVIRSDHG